MQPRVGIAAVVTMGAALLVTSACGAVPPREAVPASAAPTMPTASPATSADPRTGVWTVTGDPATLTSALEAPWSVVPLAGGGALISERDSGVIRELRPDGVLREVGVVADLVAGGESGLHGLALYDDADAVWLYAYHGSLEDNRVVRMALLGGEGSYALGDAQTVVSGIPRANTHDGGRIAFGPDGMLYVATGDAQQRDAAQDPDALGGKILRVTPDGAAAPGNPFGTSVYSLGHRNVQGLTWTADGAMWASEFGQDTWDELNKIVPGGNYGWPLVEGAA